MCALWTLERTLEEAVPLPGARLVSSCREAALGLYRLVRPCKRSANAEVARHATEIDGRTGRSPRGQHQRQRPERKRASNRTSSHPSPDRAWTAPDTVARNDFQKMIDCKTAQHWHTDALSFRLCAVGSPSPRTAGSPLSYLRTRVRCLRCCPSRRFESELPLREWLVV